jgi:hypothetical protein
MALLMLVKAACQFLAFAKRMAFFKSNSSISLGPDFLPSATGPLDERSRYEAF